MKGTSTFQLGIKVTWKVWGIVLKYLKGSTLLLLGLIGLPVILGSATLLIVTRKLSLKTGLFFICSGCSALLPLAKRTKLIYTPIGVIQLCETCGSRVEEEMKNNSFNMQDGRFLSSQGLKLD